MRTKNFIYLVIMKTLISNTVSAIQKCFVQNWRSSCTNDTFQICTRIIPHQNNIHNARINFKKEPAALITFTSYICKTYHLIVFNVLRNRGKLLLVSDRSSASADNMLSTEMFCKISLSPPNS